MRIVRRCLRLLPVLALLLVLGTSGTTASAATSSKPVTITKCRLVSAKKAGITARISDKTSVNGNRCYLFALALSDSKLSRKMVPLASKPKAAKMTFTVKLNITKTSSLLYSRFVIADRKANGTYRIISNAQYLTNPRKAAQYRYSFPTAASKKGLQVSANMLEDAVELNVRNSAFNIVLSDLIPTKAECNDTFSISYKYHGATYWFRRASVNSYDAHLAALRENNAVVSAILLLGWRNDLRYLIYPDGREAGHSFYAWNTQNARAREQLQATLSFLASRYTASSAPHGRIVNWIVGNEVNNYRTYNYAGIKTLQQYAKIYADAFRMTYNTIASVYANARVYISLDHLWNTRVSGSFTAREMLDAFAEELKENGNIRWNLAFHPYGSPLTEPRFWANTNGQAVQSLTSPVISMANIGVLTSYIRKKYGSDTRIILSEQGYTSVRHTMPGTSLDIRLDAQREQAAAIAYSYYLTEADDMIDSFIMNRHVDHQVEIDQGLDLGLWTTDPNSSLPEWADTKKQSWEAFKYMDSNRADEVTADALPILGVSSWSDLIPGYDPASHAVNIYASAAPQKGQRCQATVSMPADWKLYGAASGLTKGKSALRAGHNASRNRNSLWGFSQTFPNALNLTSASWLCTTLKVHGAAAAKAQVTIRIYSGSHILESSRVISCDKSVHLGVPLQSWTPRSAVNKIQVLVSPVSGGWAADAYLKITPPVCGV